MLAKSACFKNIVLEACHFERDSKDMGDMKEEEVVMEEFALYTDNLLKEKSCFKISDFFLVIVCFQI